MINYVNITNQATSHLSTEAFIKNTAPSFKGELTPKQVDNKVSFRLLGRAALFLLGAAVWNGLAKANILPDAIFPGCDANMLYKGGVMSIITGFFLQVISTCRK